MDTIRAAHVERSDFRSCGAQGADRFHSCFECVEPVEIGRDCSLFVVQNYGGGHSFLLEANSSLGQERLAQMAALGERLGDPALFAWKPWGSWLLATDIADPLLPLYLASNPTPERRAALALEFVDLMGRLVRQELLPTCWEALCLQVSAAGRLRIFELCPCETGGGTLSWESLGSSVRSTLNMLFHIAPDWHVNETLSGAIRDRWATECQSLLALRDRAHMNGFRFFRLLLQSFSPRG